MRSRLGRLGGAALLVGTLPAGAFADGLPKTFTWTSYSTSSSGYAASVAIGSALADEGFDLRILPAKNDISRMTPLKNKRVAFSAMGVGAFQAQEGVLDFATRKWGPQSIRLVMMGWGDSNTALPATAKDAKVKSAADLKGKRVAWVVGGPALNHNMSGWLAYGGLTWHDVIKVEVPGWKQSIQGMIDGQIDAAIASTNSSMLIELDRSPRGLAFFSAPAEEKENWARLLKVTPWFVPHTATVGVGISDKTPHVGATYGYPILITYDWMSEQAVYELVKLMHTKYSAYKDGHSAAAGFAMDRQVFKWLIPYHPGAIRYFKEIGVWNDDFQAHTNEQLERQNVLRDTWMKVKGAKRDEGEQYTYWMNHRAAALEAAGFDPVWGGLSGTRYE